MIDNFNELLFQTLLFMAVLTVLVAFALG